jgi:hypothetical protein
MAELGNNFCSACGNKLILTAVICPSCGSPTAKFAASSSNTRVKSKSTAVLLAVFFGFWTWLYTYQINKAKFWIALVILSIVGVIWGFVFAQYSQQSSTYASCSTYMDLGPGDVCYPPSFPFDVLIILWIVQFAFWLIAVIDASTSQHAEYDSYPNS